MRAAIPIRNCRLVRMAGIRSLSMVLTMVLAACSGTEQPSPDTNSPPEEITVEEAMAKAFQGIGGRPALLDLKNFSIEAARERYMMGQGPEPGKGLFRVSTSDVSVRYDISGERLRLDFAHTNHYRMTREVTELIDKQSGFVMGSDDFYLQKEPVQMAINPDRRAAVLRTERLLNPHILLQALASNSRPASLVKTPPATHGRRFSADEVFPVSFSRIRVSGRRTIVTNDQWLQRWQGSEFFEQSIEDFEVDSKWLDRQLENDVQVADHIRLTVEDDVYPITLWIDRTSGRITKLTTMEHDVVYGDVPLEITYRDWQTFDGVYFPMDIKMFIAGAPAMKVKRSEVAVNPTFDAGIFTPPEGVTYQHDEDRASRGARLSQTLQGFSYTGASSRAVGRPEIVAKELADGVYLLDAIPTDAVLVLVVEQSEGVVVVEPGFFDLKGEAIIDWISERFPGKPITHAIVSHSHSDHAGGIRPYMAEGAAIVVHEAGRDYYETQFKRPKSTILPDALDRNPAPVNITTVAADKPFRIDDPQRPVVVYPVKTGHITDMVMIALEKERILYAGDLYISALARFVRAGITRDPSTEAAHSAVELEAAIRANGLQGVTLVGSHDSEPVEYSVLASYVEP